MYVIAVVALRDVAAKSEYLCFHVVQLYSPDSSHRFKIIPSYNILQLG